VEKNYIFLLAFFQIIKDIILERTKAYSPVHLFTVFTEEFEKYYIGKLLSISNGRIPNYLMTNHRRMERKSRGLQLVQGTTSPKKVSFNVKTLLLEGPTAFVN